MAPSPRLTALQRLLLTRQAGWWLVAAFALLGILLGAQRLTRAAGSAGQALAEAIRLVLGAGWLLLLLGAGGLAFGLALSGRRGRVAGRWLRPRLTGPPVRWGATGAGLLVVLVLVVLVLPPRFTAHRHFDNAADELKAQNDVRTTLLQALAGGVLILGAYFTYRQLRVTREGQITDRYTKAVDQLGSEHLDVRLGGIYALERIARDSPPDRATIEEVLTAYLRGHAPWPPPPHPPSRPAVTQRLVTFMRRRRSALPQRTARDTAQQAQQRPPDETVAEPQGPAADVPSALTVLLRSEPPPQGPAADVQAALTVLGRRGLPPGGLRALDLTRVDLRRAELGGTNLQGARFVGANLQGAVLDHADLQGAVLTHADLKGARLHGASLQHAVFDYADLQGAWLARADLHHANLMNAKLQGAVIFDAKLQGARLLGANLQGAWVNRADLQSAQLSGANLQGAWLDDANLQGALVGDANLQDAVLRGTNLHDARLGDAGPSGLLLGVTNLQGAHADEATRWPAGWDRAKAKLLGVRYGD
jgi:uncharacterized protein YjbI with pentapeptide repeats